VSEVVRGFLGREPGQRRPACSQSENRRLPRNVADALARFLTLHKIFQRFQQVVIHVAALSIGES
jgi:hypothetical protein